MLAYLILTGHAGRPVSFDWVERFRSHVPDVVPFEPEDHLVWTSRDRTVVFIGWQAFTDLAGIGSHWAADDRGLTAFSGHCWPRDAGWDHRLGTTWAVRLRGYLDKHSILDARETLYGHHTLIDLSNDGPGIVTPDFASMAPLFRAERDGVTAISNRAGLCAAAVTSPGTEPARSIVGAGWIICHTEMFFDGETGYWDVERIPLGAHVALSPSRGAIVIQAERCPLGPMGDAATYDELLPLVETDLRQTVRAIASLPVATRTLALSGGIDSRLLTAAIISEGLHDRFRFVTTGSPQRSDVIVAQSIASRYGLDWSTDDRSHRPLATEHADILAHTWRTEGLMNGWNLASGATDTDGVIITGLAGEYLRWGRTSRAGLTLRTESELSNLLRRNIAFDPLGIMQPGALAYYYDVVDQWAADLLARGERLQQIPSYFNQSGQSRHRFSIVQAWSTPMTLTPYFTPAIIRANQQLPLDRRPNHGFQIDLFRRFVPELAVMPFAARGWTPEAVAHLPDADAYLAIPPVVSASGGETWRLLRYADYRPMLDTYMLDRSNPIHELIRSDRLPHILETGNRHDGRVRRIWALLTAAIWMGHHETRSNIAR